MEIWRIHLYERTLTAWRHQPNGSYTELARLGGAIPPAALPNVNIVIDDRFD